MRYSIRNMFIVLAFASLAEALQGVSLTPPMGWSSWNAFFGNIDETKIKNTVDLMVSNGMRDAGYIYVNLDDNWMANPARDAQGNLIADPVRFPSGIKGLADYVHSQGMKLGIYGDRGSMTCMDIPKSGGYGNENRDAETYASWGVDYLKYDNCNPVGQLRDDYTKMSSALKSTARPIVFSICAWQTQEWMPATGQLWRSTTDIKPYWVPSPTATLNWSITTNLDGNADMYIFTRPGAWSDPDMLEVGNGTLTAEETKTHFGLWALMAAPLIAGTDISKISSTNLALITHPEVIAIDQDSAGAQGHKIQKMGDLEVWAKPLGRNYTEYAVGLLNRSGSTSKMSVRWKDLHLNPQNVSVRDVWAKSDLGTIPDSFSVNVPSHGLALIRVRGIIDKIDPIWVSDLHITSVTNSWKFLQVDKSIEGQVLTIGNQTYPKGLGSHAPSTTNIYLHGKFERFQSDIGVDAEKSGGSVIFQVFGDGEKLYESPLCKGGAAPISIDVPVKGVDTLQLIVTDGGNGIADDHADWAGAKLVASEPIPQQPFHDTLVIPGVVQVEDYDKGEEGVAFHDMDAINSGNVYRTDGVDITGNATNGYSLGWTTIGEWLEYTVHVTHPGKFKWEAKVSAGGDSAAFHVLLDTTNISGTVKVPNTGDWDTYTTLSGTTPTLTAGTHVLKLAVDGSYFNIDWISFSEPSVALLPSLTGKPYSPPGSYTVYNITGNLIGTVNLNSGEDIQTSVAKLLTKPGVYLAKEKSSGKTILVKAMH